MLFDPDDIIEYTKEYWAMFIVWPDWEKVCIATAQDVYRLARVKGVPIPSTVGKDKVLLGEDFWKDQFQSGRNWTRIMPYKTIGYVPCFRRLRVDGNFGSWTDQHRSNAQELHKSLFYGDMAIDPVTGGDLGISILPEWYEHLLEHEPHARRGEVLYTLKRVVMGEYPGPAKARMLGPYIERGIRGPWNNSAG